MNQNVRCMRPSYLLRRNDEAASLAVVNESLISSIVANHRGLRIIQRGNERVPCLIPRGWVFQIARASQHSKLKRS